MTMKISVRKLRQFIKESLINEEVSPYRPGTWPEYKVTTTRNMSLGGREDENFVFEKIFGLRSRLQGYEVNATIRGYKEKGDTFFIISPTDPKLIMKNAKQFSSDLTIEPAQKGERIEMVLDRDFPKRKRKI